MTTTTATSPLAMAAIALDGLLAVPGIRLRRWRGLDTDLPGMWAAADATRVADGEHERTSFEAMATYTNPNQALALCESCGFRVVSGATSYRKPLLTAGPSQPEKASR